MKAEETIQTMYDNFPELFQERWEVLDHLFCVIGNGYKWDNGELISDSYKDKNGIIIDNMIRDPEDRYKWINNPEFKEEFLGQLDSNGKAIQRTSSEMYNNFMKRFNKDVRWYGCSKGFSYLLKYPENIKPDWLEILNECKQMMIDDGIDIPEAEIFRV